MAAAAPLIARALTGAAGSGAASAAGSAGSAAGSVEGIAKAGEAVKGLTGDIDKLGAVSKGSRFGALIEGVQKFVGQIRQMDAALNAPLKAFQGFIGQIQSSVASFVAKSNPALVQQWTLAVDDFMGVVGRAFGPLLKQAGEIVRTVGYALASLSPQGQGFTRAMSGVSLILSTVGEVIKRIAPAFVRVGEVLGPVFNAVEKAIKSLAGAVGEGLAFGVNILARALQAVTPLIELFANAIEFVGDVIGEALRQLNIATGTTEGFKPGASRGASVRQTQISDLNSVINRQYAAAFASANDPQAKTAKATEETAKNTATMVSLLENMNPAQSVKVAGVELNPIRTSANVATWPLREGLRMVDRR